MSRVFITGSTDGLGLAAARKLIEEGHAVILHARSRDRAAAFADLAPRSATVVIGDLSSSAETHDLAQQVNALGSMDAVIHNAGVYRVPTRSATPEGHARTLAVNTLAPYMLTALLHRPRRLIYLSSGMHRSGSSSLADVDWAKRSWDQTQAYCDSKLFVTALALAIAKRWSNVLSNAVDPGWVPTKMGGAGASDDLEMGHLTQAWLAVSNEPDASITGKYWYHREHQSPAAAASDPHFQDRLITTLEKLTGVKLM